jgi:preprotein translocase subunit SecY
VSLVKYYGKPVKNLSDKELADAFVSTLEGNIFSLGVAPWVKKAGLIEIFLEAMSRIKSLRKAS